MAGSARDDDEDAITGINVTPLVDIVLVLLIIFMVTASYIVAPSIRVELPSAATSEPSAPSQLALVITKDGKTYLNNHQVTDEQLREFIRQERRAGKDPEAILAADRNVLHGRVVALIDLIKQEGVLKFALNTQADFESEAAPN
ncbi:MAG: biopolymer transporter ExbD [Deltaproteobacteria bacterium]|nr:biopolymer transporter ExbD [Deltaproteobacteria bacterium]